MYTMKVYLKVAVYVESPQPLRNLRISVEKSGHVKPSEVIL